MQRIVSFITSALFVICLFSPLVLWIMTSDKEISDVEKRRLAPRPELELSRKSLREFPQKFEKYFDDHLGGRKQLIGLYHDINFKFFGISPVAKVTLGNDNWLFLKGDGVLADYMGMGKEDIRDLEGFKRVLVDRRNWLAERNIKYLFLPVPNKMMVYDEYLPYRMRREAGVTFYDRFLQYINDYSDFKEYLDVKSILLQAKKEELVFLLTDTHWNSDGSFIVYQHIMDSLRPLDPQVKILQRSDLKKREVKHSGDLTYMMNMVDSISEIAPSNKIINRCADEKPKKLKTFVHKIKKRSNDQRYLPVVNGCPGEQLTAVVIHDSFGNFLRPLLSESFSHVIFMHYSDFNGLKDLIDKERPDVVIDQRVARYIGSAMKRDQELETYFVTKHFNEQQQILMELNENLIGLENIDLHDLTLSQNQQGLMLEATADDPYIVMPFTPDRDNEPLMVKIVLTSPHETELQIMYTTILSPQFVPSQMVQRKIHKGVNELLFRLPDPDVSGKLRLDPGMKPGKYILESLIIKRERTRLAEQ